MTSVSKPAARIPVQMASGLLPSHRERGTGMTFVSGMTGADGFSIGGTEAGRVSESARSQEIFFERDKGGSFSDCTVAGRISFEGAD